MTSGLEDGDDPLKEARAFNTSILFMLTVPYVILAVGGFALWRLSRQRRVPHAPAPAAA